MKITKQYIFEQKLRGNPISVFVNQITEEEIQCLIDCGIVEQFSKSPRKLSDLNLVLALYPVINFRQVVTSTGRIVQDSVLIKPGTGRLKSVVKLKSVKSLISKET